MFSTLVCLFSLFLAAMYVDQAFAFQRLSKQYKELADKYETLYKSLRRE